MTVIPTRTPVARTPAPRTLPRPHGPQARGPRPRRVLALAGIVCTLIAVLAPVGDSGGRTLALDSGTLAAALLALGVVLIAAGSWPRRHRQ